MSILFMDNFSNYGSSTTGRANMLTGVYADASSSPIPIADPDGVSGGYVLRCSDGGLEDIRFVLPGGSVTTLGIAVRIYCDSLPEAGDAGILQWRDAANAAQIKLRVNSTGTLSLVRGSTVVSTTTVPHIVAGSWIHIETKVLFDQSAGTFELRVNEETVLDLTGIDTCATANTECSQFTLTNIFNWTVYFKDLIVWDDGGSVNNDFLGDCEVVSIYPDADDTFTGWASTGANAYSVLDETTPDDTDYITADATDTTGVIVTLTDLDPDITTIKGLQTFVRAYKTDGGSASVQPALISAGDYDNGTDRPVATSATYYWDVSELSPDTAAAWTRSEVDAAKLSIDRTA